MDGVGYLFKKFRIGFENDTDQVAIERGYGWQIHDYITQLLANPNVLASYKAYKRKVYYTPEKVLEELKKNHYQMN